MLLLLLLQQQPLLLLKLLLPMLLLLMLLLLMRLLLMQLQPSHTNVPQRIDLECVRARIVEFRRSSHCTALPQAARDQQNGDERPRVIRVDCTVG
jgi:hypothetical protein